MTRFRKIYGDYVHRKKESSEIPKNSTMNREGYGYIKRRVGLLSNELKSPTYLATTELSEFIFKNTEIEKSDK